MTFFSILHASEQVPGTILVWKHQHVNREKTRFLLSFYMLLSSIVDMLKKLVYAVSQAVGHKTGWVMNVIKRPQMVGDFQYFECTKCVESGRKVCFLSRYPSTYYSKRLSIEMMTDISCRVVAYFLSWPAGKGQQVEKTLHVCYMWRLVMCPAAHATSHLVCKGHIITKAILP